MIFVGTTQITAGLMVGTTIGGVGLLLLFSSRLGFSFRHDRPIAYVFLFLLAGMLSTATTDYGLPAIQKGALNLGAMIAMLLMVMVIKQVLMQSPTLFQHLVRITAITAGIAGLSVIFQSVVYNLIDQRGLFDLSFVNELWGRGWWRPVGPGRLIRAQGIFGEPSFVAGYVGVASGLAMTRLGFLGVKLGRALHGIVPVWAAISVLTSLTLTFSGVAYVGLLSAFSAALATKTPIKPRSILYFLFGSAIAFGLIVLLARQAGGVLVNRFAGIAVFGQLNDVGVITEQVGTINFTVQVLFLNAYVALQNLIADPVLGAGVGAHPFAYAALLPSLSGLPGGSLEAAGLNDMDAGALVLRLLSETGIVGTSLFLAAILSAWFRVRRIVVTGTSPHDALNAMAVGLNGGLVGVFAALLIHIPTYYAPEFWGLFALCVVLPSLSGIPLDSRGYLRDEGEHPDPAAAKNP